MFLTYDSEADAIYVYAADKERTYMTSLDDDRHVDFAADGTAVGVEFLNVSLGLDLTDVPDADLIAAMLEPMRAANVE